MEGVIRPRQGAAGMARPVMSAASEMVQVKPKAKAKSGTSSTIAQVGGVRMRDKTRPESGVKLESDLQVKQEPAESGASGAPVAAGDRRSGSPVPSNAPSRLSSARDSKDGKDPVTVPDGCQLDQEMARVQQRLGPPFQTCLQALVVERHLSGEKLGVRLCAVPGRR